MDEDGPAEPAPVESLASNITPKVKKQIDFIAQIVLHIPDVHEKSVIYYGYYSNRSRGRRIIFQVAPVDDATGTAYPPQIWLLTFPAAQ